MNIRIDRLKLRLLDDKDAEQFFGLIDRNRVYLRDYFPVTISIITSIEKTTEYVAGKKDEAQKKECISVVIEDENGILHGYISIKKINWRVSKCELAYFIDKGHEGHGIMAKALGAIVDYCFDVLQMNKLYLTTAIDNYPGRRIVEKNGFEIEEILRKDFKLHSGGLVDMAYYGIIRKEE